MWSVNITTIPIHYIKHHFKISINLLLAINQIWKCIKIHYTIFIGCINLTNLDYIIKIFKKRKTSKALICNAGAIKRHSCERNTVINDKTARVTCVQVICANSQHIYILIHTIHTSIYL